MLNYARITLEERLTLVPLVLDLDIATRSDAVAGELTTAWKNEIRARIRAVDEGCVSGIPYDQIMREMTNRFGSQ